MGNIAQPQMAEKTSPDAPPNCAVVPLYYSQCGKGIARRTAELCGVAYK